MEIKRPSNEPPGIGRTGESRPAEAKTGQTFSVDAGKTAPAAATPAGLAKVRAEFKRADLADPAKADRMVQLSAGELVDSWGAKSGSLSEQGRKSVADWMGSDPIMRGKILRYLDRVLD